MKLLMQTLLCGLCVVLSTVSQAQPLAQSYPFTIINTELPSIPSLPTTLDTLAGSKGRIKVSSDGHFVTPTGERIRFLGTELRFTAQFLNSVTAKDLAAHLRKLGINAVRFTYNDYPYWNDANFVLNDGTGLSTKPNPEQFAKFDTLQYELKQAGIYSFIVLNNYHFYLPNDGVYGSDSVINASNGVHFMDDRAAQLQREWTKTLLGHKNPLTNLRYCDDPAVVGVELSANQNLYYLWRFNYLNHDPAATSLSYRWSRKLDTLYSTYLKKKYGSDAQINNAWRGPAVVDPGNKIDNGSFEKLSSSAWSFSAGNGANAGRANISPGKDSQFCVLVQIENVGPNPQWYDVYLQNISPRLGKDTLYELSFWAKLQYSDALKLVNRTVYCYFADYNTQNPTLVSQFFNIDTSWKQIRIPIRAVRSGLHILYLGVGHQMGDVLLDGVVVKQIPEQGLPSNESSVNNTIRRILMTERGTIPLQRARDNAMFYDSLQRAYYRSMMKVIKDTLRSQMLVNNFGAEWWSMISDAHLNKESEYTVATGNTDYMRQMPNTAYSDSTLYFANRSPLLDRGGYLFGFLSSFSIEGKPHIVNFFDPSLHQHYAQTIPWLASYASLQDWDGLFFTPYATYRDVLLGDRIFPATGGYLSSLYDISANPAIEASLPMARAMFKDARISPSDVTVTVPHTQDNIMLVSTFSDYRHPFGVQGNLEPNIATIYKMRQKFDAAKDKLASEFPYVPDTSAKIADTGELIWEQSSGYLRINSPKMIGAVGFFGSDTVKIGAYMFRRLDAARDNMSLLFMPKDTVALSRSSTFFLSIITRGQNTDMTWSGDTSVTNKWGFSPTVLGNADIDFMLPSDSERVVLYPVMALTGSLGEPIEAEKIEGTKYFRADISTRYLGTPWYVVTMTNESLSVRRGEVSANKPALSVYPNPARSTGKAILQIFENNFVTLTISNVLGMEVWRSDTEQLGSGEYEIPLPLDRFGAGTYILRAKIGDEMLSAHIVVIE